MNCESDPPFWGVTFFYPLETVPSIISCSVLSLPSLLFDQYFYIIDKCNTKQTEKAVEEMAIFLEGINVE